MSRILCVAAAGTTNIDFGAVRFEGRSALGGACAVFNDPMLEFVESALLARVRQKAREFEGR